MPGASAYIGLWMDYDNDGIGRATLTLPVKWATYLISGLALLVSTAGTSCWIIAAYALHQSLVRPTATFDPLHLQLQVLLRNTGSGISAMKELVMIQGAWPRHETSKRSFVRVLPVALVAFVVVASFAVASVFVAAIASRAEEDIVTLTKPGTVCGWILGSDITSGNEGGIATLGWLANSSLRARGYARNWYSRDNSLGTPPSVFPVRALPYTVGIGPCPFPGEGRCISHNSSSPNTAMVLDTGLLDSHAHFGVNGPKKNRIRSRIVTTCSPLNVSEFIRKTTDIDEETYYDLAVGDFQRASQNITFRTNAHSNKDFIGYYVRSVSHSPDVTKSRGWVPIPPFERADAEVSIYVIAQNSITYLGPVYDPLFLADGDLAIQVGNTTSYIPNHFFNTMGCIDQYQFCNPNNRGCTAATSLIKAYDQGIDILDLNAQQKAVLNRTSFAFVGCSSFWNGIGYLGVGGLLANEITYADLISPPLPPNQWQKEVVLWFQTGLSRIQWEMFNFVDQSGSITPGLDVHSVADMAGGPVREELWNMCMSQKTSSAGQVQNFNFTGLMVIICFSLFIITLAFVLEPCVQRFQMWRGSASGRLRQISLDMDGKYRLLQAMLEGQGVGPWRKGGRKKSSEIPVVDEMQMLQLRIPDQDGLSPYQLETEVQGQESEENALTQNFNNANNSLQH